MYTVPMDIQEIFMELAGMPLSMYELMFQTIDDPRLPYMSLDVYV